MIDRLPAVPPHVDVDARTRETLIGAVKLVLGRMKQAGLLDNSIEYPHLLGDARRMADFIRLFKNNRRLAQDLALDIKGRAVEADDERLVCGVTLAQVERMLVFTCAKRVFQDGGKETIPPGIESYIAFAWQLPLLEAYKVLLSPAHIKILDANLLLLRDIRSIRAVAVGDPSRLRQAMDVAGPRFAEAIAANPDCLAGLGRVEKAVFDRLARYAGPRIWDTLAHEAQVVAELAGRPPERLKALGPSMGDICLAALLLLDDVPSHLFEPFMESFRAILGPEGGALLGDEAFVREILREVVERFRSLKDMPENKRGNIAEIADLKWSALAPKIDAWRAGRPAAS
ncbi:MAG: hypothetical protein H7841_02005 [Magnetospirillum sp. WYHS-4]